MFRSQLYIKNLWHRRSEMGMIFKCKVLLAKFVYNELFSKQKQFFRIIV